MTATQPDPTGADLQSHPAEDLHAASVHLEDLEIFVGQRSRMHPGPGWALVLAMIRSNLSEVREEIASRLVAEQFAMASDETALRSVRPPATPASPDR